MKKNEIINYLVLALILTSVGYAIYIQSKQGIPVIGTNNVIDPFLYETGIFNDYSNGINPYSTANHITEDKLQSIKFNKIWKVLIFTLPLIFILFFIARRKSDELDLPIEDELNFGKKNNIDANIGVANKNLMSTQFPNFIKFCKLIESDLQAFKHVDTKEKIEFKVPIITYGKIIMNKNWNFYFGIEKRNLSHYFYIKCVSTSGKIFDSQSVQIENYDLTENQYDQLYGDNYLKILINPDYGLITSNQM